MPAPTRRVPDPKPAPNPRVVPKGGSFDIVSVVPDFEPFIDYRKNRFGAAVREMGYSHHTHVGGDYGSIRFLLENNSVRVILDETLRIAKDRLALLAADYPHTQFIGLCHADPRDAYLHGTLGHRVDSCLDLATLRDNVRFGHVMPEIRFVGHPKMAHVVIPNVPTVPDEFLALPRKRPRHPVRILIAGRADPLKGWGVAVETLLRLHECEPTRAFEVTLLVPDRTERIEIHARRLRLAGIMTFVERWKPWSLYFSALPEMADVLLAPSVSESFGLTAWECAAHGIPVIGSHALWWLPPACRFDHADVEGLWRGVVRDLRDYERSSRAMVHVAEQTRRTHLSVLRDSLKELLGCA